MRRETLLLAAFLVGPSRHAAAEAPPSPPSPAAAPRPSIALVSAITALKAGDLQQARTALESIPSDDPHYAMALHNLGIVLGQLGEHAAAVTRFQALTDLAPGDHEAWTNLGWARYENGDFAAAATAARSAIERGATDPRVLFNLGLFSAAAGDPAATLESYRKALASPETASRFDEAGDDLKALARKQPDNRAVSFAQALLRHSVGDAKGTRELLEDVLADQSSASLHAAAREILATLPMPAAN